MCIQPDLKELYKDRAQVFLDWETCFRTGTVSTEKSTGRLNIKDFESSKYQFAASMALEI
ncbi:hypothetical protein H5410_055263 [Solanum commersonii]|uniref:Uncharacterized protein n=1 Tax=Solanum commersonii TaxID=4109 RepID=A0A9J5WH42_SOLCO|nr:hypothetical protein H5410_055263 [Solanum commersonii]